MNRKRRKPVTAEQLVKELRADPDWVARQESREQKRQVLARAIYDTESPLVEDLRKAGFDVESAWDLFNRKEPWRKDIPIHPWRKAVPILLEHFDRSYPFPVKEGIIRALIPPWVHVALDRLVEELRRTADPKVAALEQGQAVELVMGEAGEIYSRDEVEMIMEYRWESFRFAIAFSIGEHFQQEDIPLIVQMLQDEGHGRVPRRALADALQKKMRRWRRKDAEVLALVDSLKSP